LEIQLCISKSSLLEQPIRAELCCLPEASCPRKWAKPNRSVTNNSNLTFLPEAGGRTDTVSGLLQDAIHQDDSEAVVRLLRANPNLLHIPLWSGNWGPPMSHAANLGRLEIIKAVAALGARDYQHAFDRPVRESRLRFVSEV
jgi:hypothetical protein